MMTRKAIVSSSDHCNEAWQCNMYQLQLTTETIRTDISNLNMASNHNTAARIRKVHQHHTALLLPCLLVGSVNGIRTASVGTTSSNPPVEVNGSHLRSLQLLKVHTHRHPVPHHMEEDKAGTDSNMMRERYLGSKVDTMNKRRRAKDMVER